MRDFTSDPNKLKCSTKQGENRFKSGAYTNYGGHVIFWTAIWYSYDMCPNICDEPNAMGNAKTGEPIIPNIGPRPGPGQIICISPYRKQHARLCLRMTWSCLSAKFWDKKSEPKLKRWIRVQGKTSIRFKSGAYTKYVSILNRIATQAWALRRFFNLGSRWRLCRRHSNPAQYRPCMLQAHSAVL